MLARSYIIIVIIFQSDDGVEFNVVGSSLLAISDDYSFNHVKGKINFFLENIGNTIQLDVTLFLSRH